MKPDPRHTHPRFCSRNTWNDPKKRRSFKSNSRHVYLMFSFCQNWLERQRTDIKDRQKTQNMRRHIYDFSNLTSHPFQYIFLKINSRFSRWSSRCFSLLLSIFFRDFSSTRSRDARTLETPGNIARKTEALAWQKHQMFTLLICTSGSGTNDCVTFGRLLLRRWDCVHFPLVILTINVNCLD